MTREYLLPVRVLQIVAAPSAATKGGIGVNGPERRSANLIGAWRERLIIPIVAYPRRGLLWTQFAESGEHVEDFEIGSKWAFHRVLSLFRLIRRHGIRVVHTQGPASLDLIAGLAARMAGVPLIVTRPVMIEDMVTNAAWRRSLYQAVDRIGLRLSRSIVAVSDQGADRLRRLVPHLRTQISVTRNGVSLGRFRPIAAQRRERESVTIGMTAQLTPQKSWPDFLGVIARLRNKGLPVRGLIVGSGPLRAELEALSRDQGLAPWVEFAGFHEDVAPQLARMDIFLFTSSWEGLSVAVIEAMASGLPVVATDVAAIREQVVDGLNGRVCPAGDLDALAAACGELVRDPAKRLQQGRQSAERARVMFDEEQMFEGYVNLYRSLA